MALTPSIAHLQLPSPCGKLFRSFSKVKHFLNTRAGSKFIVCLSTLRELNMTPHPTHRFIFATESYGGHYGPEFVTYFEQQNALIRSRKMKGVEIVVSALMINK
jgi:hypothetical protein